MVNGEGRHSPNIVYFNLDEDALPMRCVRGKAKAQISEDPKYNVVEVRKMVLKYIGNTEDPTAKQMLDAAGSSESALIQLTPLYYSAWDFTKNSCLGPLRCQLC